ncbi:endonuclease [Vibrio sp. L5-1]|jgi:deoxyribonuclease-1|uniref:Endonuclease n=1 Tax=Vibrio qingdaonensis TaxID=2829491 RepID=A0A9X3CRJ4_9VIBR|nr:MULTISPECIES: endonuclease [Vibrio]MCF7498013.1 endonuclease [Vibrio sp. L5-1]MCW8348224.1 endonuclease [Vibrio qingdaonensis]MDL5029481.1 endonuclease [Vibrio sp. TMPB1044]MDN5209609.1 endonuclease [Vibrio sp. TMPB1044]NOH77914.1 endonuclease I [Vibrio crassostreae]
MKRAFVTTVLLFPLYVFAGNNHIESFSTAKKQLEQSVYFDHRKTLYCNASFDGQKFIIPPPGFKSDKYEKRAKKVEWEHVVPAENFGRTFIEWREGDELCVNSKGQAYKGRRCANKANQEYRLMQSDLYNLFPAIGSVNAMRSNYNFTMLPNEQSDFGLCAMKISERKVEPPMSARGRIARTYLYMEETYARYNMSKQQRQLMMAWDKQFPVSTWECKRADRIELIQGNVNTILKKRCH